MAKKTNLNAETQNAKIPSGQITRSCLIPRTRITADESLDFRCVRRLCHWEMSRLQSLRKREFSTLTIYRERRKGVCKPRVHRSVSDADVFFPPRFPVYSRSDFMKRVFWPAIKYKGALVVGFNLPFDLARLALDWSRGDKDEWSLTMSRYSDGSENGIIPALHPAHR